MAAAASESESESESGRKVQSRIRPKKKMRLGRSMSLSPMSPSSRLLSMKHDQSVYVRVVNIDEELEWYSFVFDASDEDDERKRGLSGFGDYLRAPTPLKMNKISPFSSCAAVGSTMYCFGGRSVAVGSTMHCVIGRSTQYLGRLSNKVHYLDTNLPQPSWMKGPSMLNARSDFHTVALNGKIYVIGGTEGCGIYEIGGAAGCVSEPWAEVFNPKSNMWFPLPSPPSPKPSDLGLFSAALHDFNKFVIGSSEDDFLYLYNVMTECWERLDNEMDYSPCSAQPVAVGTTLLWFEDSKLHAYDLFEKWHKSGRIKGLKKIVSLYGDYSPVLLHVADDQFYCTCFDNSDGDLTLLHCVKFRVSELFVHNDKGHLKAFAESCQSYLIRMPSMMLDAVLMSP